MPTPRWTPRSHREAAWKVQHLRRNDPDHEAVCRMASERILGLAAQVAELESALSRAQASAGGALLAPQAA